MVKEKHAPQINEGKLVDRPFHAWIQNEDNLSLWVQYPTDRFDDSGMMHHIAIAFEHPQNLSAEIIYRLALRGGRLQERNYNPGKAPQKIYELYKKGYEAITNCSEENPVLINSLAFLLHEQDFFAEQPQPTYIDNLLQPKMQKEFEREQRKKELEKILHNPQKFSPEKVFQTTLAYAALPSKSQPTQDTHIWRAHAYRKGLNALAGCSTIDTNLIPIASRLFSDQSIFTQQMLLVPTGKGNENGYQTRANRYQEERYKMPQKPERVPIVEYDHMNPQEYESYSDQIDDRVTIVVFNKPRGEEQSPLQLNHSVLLLQRHPDPYQKGIKDWYSFRWEAVGGGIKADQSALLAAYTEVQQETSLQSISLIPYGVIPAYIDARGRQNWVYSTIVTDNPAIETCREHIQYRWITIEEALGRELARDHQAIFKQMCYKQGNQEVKEFIENLRK